MKHLLVPSALMGILVVSSCSSPSPSVSWERIDVKLSSSLRGLSVVDENTVWVSGTGGVFAHSRERGQSWVVGRVPGADSLDFRDVEAFPGGTAYLMSAGNGSSSRIYRTDDWGASWSLQHTNPHEAGFFNGMAFWDSENGMVVGDPLDGTLFLLASTDGGNHWHRFMEGETPGLLEGEYGFAASGTNISTFGENGMVVVSGGTAARVFRSTDRGQTWAVSSTPMATGNASSGIFSVSFRDSSTALIVGGDYREPDLSSGTLAISADGGSSWVLAPEPHGIGFRSGVAWRDDPNLPMWVAVGTPGSCYSLDDGQSWEPFDDQPYNAVAFSGSEGWAAGPEGRVARLLVQ